MKIYSPVSVFDDSLNGNSPFRAESKMERHGQVLK